jgi:hypothetical protein
MATDTICSQLPEGAFVEEGLPVKIFLCPDIVANLRRGMNFNLKTAYTRLVIHELAHEAGVPGDVYGERASQLLAQGVPQQAVDGATVRNPARNADNYAYLADRASGSRAPLAEELFSELFSVELEDSVAPELRKGQRLDLIGQ